MKNHFKKTKVSNATGKDVSGRFSWIKRHKKSTVVIVFVIGYIIFCWWLFNERHIAVDDQQGAQRIAQNNEVITPEEGNEQNFTNLGNFWLDINTDKVKVKAPIVNGITDDKLDQGVGRHKTTALPGEYGNMVLSGHRWKFGDNPAYRVFEDLDKLKNGDKIVVHYGTKVFEYEVYEQGTVRPNKKGGKEILKKTDDKILTLYTCTPKYTAFKRLYYRAKLVE